MELKQLTLEAVESFIKTEISEESFKKFLDIVINEDNIINWAKFFKSLRKYDDSGKEREATREEKFYNILKMFLLFNEVINIGEVVNITRDGSNTNNLLSNEQLLCLTFAELHYFNNESIVGLPYKDYARDYIIQLYYKDFSKQSYGSEENIEKQLEKIIFNSGDKTLNGKYLCRYNRMLGDAVYQMSAECEKDWVEASAILNGNGEHLNYIAALSNSSVELNYFDFNGTLQVIKSDNINLIDHYKIKDYNGEEFKKFSKKIQDKTIHYNVE